MLSSRRQTYLAATALVVLAGLFDDDCCCSVRVAAAFAGEATTTSSSFDRADDLMTSDGMLFFVESVHESSSSTGASRRESLHYELNGDSPYAAALEPPSIASDLGSWSVVSVMDSLVASFRRMLLLDGDDNINNSAPNHYGASDGVSFLHDSPSLHDALNHATPYADEGHAKAALATPSGTYQHINDMNAITNANTTTEFCHGMFMTMFMDGLHTTIFHKRRSFNSSSDMSLSPSSPPPPPPCLNYLVGSWHLDSSSKFKGAMVYSFLLAILTEAVSSIRLTAVTKTIHADDTHHKTLRNRMGILVGLYALQALLGYALMLIAMSFSVELIVSVLVGLVVGNALFMRYDTETNLVQERLETERTIPAGEEDHDNQDDAEDEDNNERVSLLAPSGGGGGDGGGSIVSLRRR